MSGASLTTDEVATFVARGFLELPGVVADDVDEAATEELHRISARRASEDRPPAPAPGDAWGDIYPEPSAVGAVLRHPGVRRIVDGLVGPEAVFVHDVVHVTPAGDRSFQPLRADVVVDAQTAFDIRILYFPHEVPPGGGGPVFVPGTHLRRVHETQVARYRHVRGERHWAGPAGSVLVVHPGLWHRATGNPGGADRLTYEIRLGPTLPQVRRWDSSDLPDRRTAVDHGATAFVPDRIGTILRHRETWMGEHDHRLELMARARLWRYLTGDDAFDLDGSITSGGAAVVVSASPPT